MSLPAREATRDNRPSFSEFDSDPLVLPRGARFSRTRRAVSYFAKPVVASVIIVCYFAIGTAFYANVEGWDIPTCIYFQMVTVSTVGYGDLSPVSDGSRLFTVFWILIGIMVVFSQLARAVDFITQPLIHAMRRLFEAIFPQKVIDIDGDGGADFKVPRNAILHYPMELLPGFLLGLSTQLAAAAVFSKVEGWPFGTAMYHCMVTATTVGYGDTSITTAQGRAVATVHILISVALIATFINEVDTAILRRRRAQQKLKLIRAK